MTDARDGSKPIKAADLKWARWKPTSFASGPGIHIRDYVCVDYPRVTMRETDGRNGRKQTMFVDGKEVGGSEAAAAALNAPEGP